MKSNNNNLIIGVLVVFGVLNIWSVFYSNTAIADSGTTANQGSYIAVTGAVTNAIDGLWVIKVEPTEHSPSVCLYIPRNSGKSFALAAARRIKYDHNLVTHNDRSSGKLSPAKLKKGIEDREKRINPKKKGSTN